jgi:hypothetical protein
MTIFTKSWRPDHAEVFGNHPVCLEHTLHRNILFQRAALIALIENYPPDQYTLVHMGEQGSSKKEWRTGKIGKMTGEQVLTAIEQGRLWINLLHIHEVNPHYGDLLDEIYDELHRRVPSLDRTFKRIAGLLISSPRAQVYYHFDTAGQNLWQIAGSKTVYVYPAVKPFISPESLEDVMLFHREVNIPYQPWFDRYAQVFDLMPGEMLHWPLNAPHRIENGDDLSISLTTEFFTPSIRRHVWSTSGNGLLRKMGYKPSQSLKGPAYWAKVGLFAAAKKSGMLSRRRRLPVEFMLQADGLQMAGEEAR